MVMGVMRHLWDRVRELIDELEALVRPYRGQPPRNWEAWPFESVFRGWDWSVTRRDEAGEGSPYGRPPYPDPDRHSVCPVARDDQERRDLDRGIGDA